MKTNKENDSIQKYLEKILASYAQARTSEPFGKNHPLWPVFQNIQNSLVDSAIIRNYSGIELKWSAGQGNWAKVPWIAFLDHRETTTTQRGIYGVFLFRQDMSGVYLTFNQGVTEPKKEFGSAQARKNLREKAEELRLKSDILRQQVFKLDNEIDLRVESGLGVDYEYSTIAYKLYEIAKIPNDEIILQDLDAVLQVYKQYVESKLNSQTDNPPQLNENSNDMIESEFNFVAALQKLMQFITNQGYIFEPWQIAAYVTAVRTKPFVILAGISGTGKSKLPALVAEGTGGQAKLISVRPDWTDSADILGYVNLQDQFKAGLLLNLAREASEKSNQHFICIIDEMNLARVEHYFAEILSRIEDRRSAANGGFASGPLLSQRLTGNDAAEWATVGIPPNLAIIGTVNMDESTYSFSRKVLDRAFTLEFSDINLRTWETNQAGNANSLEPWPIEAWRPRATRLSQLGKVTDTDRQHIETIIEVLTEVNCYLTLAQLQVGYRTRDEVALFVLHAQEILSLFITSNRETVNPLDLALQMKILPRIVGGSNAVRQVILQFLGWAVDGKPLQMEEDAQQFLDQWESATRPLAFPEAKHPRTAARLCLMWERLLNEGFTSFWL